MKKNQIIIISAVIIFAVIAFMYLKNNSSDTSGSSIVAENKVAEFADAREILTLLNKMSGVKLDDAVFNNPAFNFLKDGTVTLVPQSPGRNNPFSPVGSDGSRLSSSTKSTNNQPSSNTKASPFNTNSSGR